MTVGKVQTTGASAGFRMPTHDEMVKAYRSITNARMKDGHIKPMKSAPKDFSKYPAYNITEPGKLGAAETVYVIKGQMYLRTQPVVPHPKPTWYKIGPAPLF